jgi:hypothetical protein
LKLVDIVVAGKKFKLPGCEISIKHMPGFLSEILLETPESKEHTLVLPVTLKLKGKPEDVLK